MKLFFDRQYYILPESVVCKDFEIYKGNVWSNRIHGEGEYGKRFDLEYDQENNIGLTLSWNEDYYPVELKNIKFCPWCGEKIDFEITKC